MGAIAAAGLSSSYSAVAQLLADNLSNSELANVPPNGQPKSPESAVAPSPDPADRVDLSDHAKAVLARAQTDQVVASELQAYVQSRWNSGETGKDSLSGQSAQSPSKPGHGPDKVLEAFDQLTGQTTAATTPQQTDSSNGWSSIFPDAFVPTRSISTSLTVDGFTISVQSDPSRLYSGIDVSGNGVSAWSKHFWPSDGAGGGSASPNGISVSIGSNPDNPAEDIVTITQNEAAATSASASSSTQGSAAIAAVSARSSSLTFVVNYATGEITTVQSSETVSAVAALAGAGR